jgi:regulator of chromosome condensation
MGRSKLALNTPNEAKNPAPSKTRAATTKATTTEKATEKTTTKKAATKPTKAAATKAAAEPKSNGKAAPRGRKRASQDDAEAPAVKATKKAKPDAAPAAESTPEEASESPSTEVDEPPKAKVNGVKKSDSQISAPRRRGPPPKPRAPGSTLNSVPAIPDHPRPAYQLLVFGNGDSSQFGMGPNATGEYPRPRMQKFFKTASDEGRLGGAGAGVESLAAGGLHTLAIDEDGKVC